MSDISKIEPCYRCGLPIPKELIREPTQYSIVWACEDRNSCAKRILDQVEQYSTKDESGNYNELSSYCSILARNPHFKWPYKFTAYVKCGESKQVVNTELTWTGLWNIHAFPSIVKDAREFAADYDSVLLTVSNEADDILYEES